MFIVNHFRDLLAAISTHGKKTPLGYENVGHKLRGVPIMNWSFALLLLILNIQEHFETRLLFGLLAWLGITVAFDRIIIYFHKSLV